jgi:hypothetical protein
MKGLTNKRVLLVVLDLRRPSAFMLKALSLC